MSSSQKQLLLVSGNLISVSQASKFTPYSAEYLSLLARKGRFEAVKVSRDWLTTRQAVSKYVKKQQIKHGKIIKSLTEAGKGNV